MKVTILCVGKLKEKFYADAVKEYKKRISRFAELEIIEIPDERIPENAKERDAETVRSREGEHILSKLKNGAHVIALCVEGKLLSSEELALDLKNACMHTSHIVFIIGGSLGLSNAVKNRSDLKLSFGRMTLPHMLMRVVLAEQIYRSFMINSGAAYHK